jgi:hypothetical protein
MSECSGNPKNCNFCGVSLATIQLRQKLPRFCTEYAGHCGHLTSSTATEADQARTRPPTAPRPRCPAALPTLPSAACATTTDVWLHCALGKSNLGFFDLPSGPGYSLEDGAGTHCPCCLSCKGLRGGSTQVHGTYAGRRGGMGPGRMTSPHVLLELASFLNPSAYR